jgi:prepilin-type N-terminal cleavage/methylation domain-containing protein
MMKKTISLFKSQQGVTLPEILAVLVILVIMISTAVPTLAAYVREASEEACVMEAYTIRSAVQAYLVEEDRNGGLNLMQVSNDICHPLLEEEKNKLHDTLEGYYTEDAQIVGFGYDHKTLKVTNFVYRVKSYEIEIKKESEVIVRARK